MIRLVHREQGLIVAPGNPLGLTGVDDLVRRRALRQPAARRRHAGAARPRAGRAGIDPDRIDGYRREEHTHLAVAAAVAAGRADCGLGIRAAARAFGLDFVPVAREPYDLVTTGPVLDTGMLDPLLALLATRAFLGQVEALGGYSTAETGRRLR